MQGHHPAIEEYTEAIFELKEDKVDVIQARIAERLEVSRPAVSEMIHRLESEGLVVIEGGLIELTESGREIAVRTVRRHRLAERFLTDMLGLSWAAAHLEAGKWEHVISPEVEEAMFEALGQPTTCPHGNPIPDSGYSPPDTIALQDLEVGDEFVVSRIPEKLEFAPGVLTFLEESRVMPGLRGKVVALAPDGTVTVEVQGKSTGLGSFVSSEILVRQ
ncbi:MAG: iron dependent repressor, metal binding and dimerization domain protein [Acidimicrobiales bacterium]